VTISPKSYFTERKSSLRYIHPNQLNGIASELNDWIWSSSHCL